jgi:hypothetical protein
MTQFMETFLNKDNATVGYERFYYSKRYLRFKSDQHRSREDYNRIGRALGYNIEKSNFLEKLRRRRERLDAMEGDIPYEYLDQIGVDRRELETCIEADVALFEEEKSKPRFPTKAIIRYAAAFYGTFRFPEGTPEEQAIRMLLESNVARCSKMIAYPELLLIFVGRESVDESKYSWLPPEVDYRRSWIAIKKLPRGLGVTRIR